MNKVSGLIIAILVLIIIGGVYKFMFQGVTKVATDGRSAIVLTAPEKDLVLEEMRAFLSSVQQIVAATTRDDMTAVAKAAKAVGKAAQGAVPGTLMGKLPLSFKKLGFDTHTKFDQLALDAESLADKNQALEQLAVLMQNCVGCHEAYRLDIETK